MMTKLVLSTLAFLCLSAALAAGALVHPRQGQPESTDQPETKAPPPEAKPVPDTAPVYVKLTTTMGDIYLELNREKAPITTANFLAYTEKGHYDGTIFHRVIPNFMIQGGGFDKDMNQKKTDKPIKNEWQNGLKNVRGSIAMARLGNQPDSATCQFFINVVDNPALDMPRDGAGYAVFGRVVAGMDVVDRIKNVRTTTKGPHANVPVDPVVITKAEKIEADAVPTEGQN